MNNGKKFEMDHYISKSYAKNNVFLWTQNRMKRLLLYNYIEQRGLSAINRVENLYHTI